MDNPLDWLPLAVCVALGVYLAINQYRKKAEQRRHVKFRDELFRQRKQRDDKRPTMVDQMVGEIDALRAIAVHGDDLTEKENAIRARLQMEDDLGWYAEGPAPIDLDQSSRDRLLAHARRDAAEALINSQSALAEVKAFRKEFAENVRYALVAFVIFALSYWWKSHGGSWQ